MATTVNLYAANVDLGLRAKAVEELRYFIWVVLVQEVTNPAGQVEAQLKLTRAFLIHECPIAIIPRHIWDAIPEDNKKQFQSQKTPPWWPHGNIASPNFVPSPYEFGRFDLELMSDKKKSAQLPLCVDAAFSTNSSAQRHCKHIILGWNFLYRINASLSIASPPPLQVHLSNKSSHRCGTLRID
jgi:hypothetical protein